MWSMHSRSHNMEGDTKSPFLSVAGSVRIEGVLIRGDE